MTNEAFILWIDRLETVALALVAGNSAAVAQANKTARQIWALLAHGRTYEPNYGSPQSSGNPGAELAASAGC